VPLLHLTVRPIAVSWAVDPILSYEGTSISKAHVREVQGDPPTRRDPCHLPEPASQAEAGVTSY
jgi:hypothetical protein